MSKTSKKNVGRPRKLQNEKAKPNDKITCDICGSVFSRSARSRHNKTRIHQASLKAINHIKKNLLDDNNKKISFKKDQCTRCYNDRNGMDVWMTKRQFDYANNLVLEKGESPMYYESEDDLYLNRIKGRGAAKDDQPSATRGGSKNVHLKRPRSRRNTLNKNSIKQNKILNDIDSDNDDIYTNSNKKQLFDGSAEEIKQRIRNMGKF